MSYFNVPQVDDGGQRTAVVKDRTTRELLYEILLELKKMNLHLEQVTDENITEGDIK